MTDLLLVFTTTILAVAYSIPVQPAFADSVNEAAQQSRHLADAGKWEDAGRVLEHRLSQTKQPTELARLKAELAHYAEEWNTFFQKNDRLVQLQIEQARAAVQASGSKHALAILETTEGQLTYWNALDGTNNWGPPTSHFHRGIQLYQELKDDVGLAEAVFYRGLVCQMQNQNELARKYFNEALELTKKTGDERLRSYVVRHIGYLQETAGQIDAARANFRQSLELRQKNDMKAFVPFALILLADFEKEQKHPDRAIQLAQQAITSARSGNSPRALYSAQLTLAKLYLDNGKRTEARRLAERSRAGAKAFGSTGDAKDATDFLEKSAAAAPRT